MPASALPFPTTPPSRPYRAAPPWEIPPDAGPENRISALQHAGHNDLRPRRAPPALGKFQQNAISGQPLAMSDDSAPNPQVGEFASGGESLRITQLRRRPADLWSRNAMIVGCVVLLAGSLGIVIVANRLASVPPEFHPNPRSSG